MRVSSYGPVVSVVALCLGFGLGCDEQGIDAPAACDDNPCDVNAICTDLAGGEYDCACNDGFAGDGLACCPDGDGDQVCDDEDNCPEDYNPDQVDDDENDIGDECEGEAGTVVIPIEDLSTSAQWFDWETTVNPSTTVTYFAVLGSDGDPHVAFDACDVCFAAKLGYSQSGENMMCNNCSNEYPINGIGTENTDTGCWPGYLPVEITESEVIIQISDLNGGAWYFE